MDALDIIIFLVFAGIAVIQVLKKIVEQAQSRNDQWPGYNETAEDAGDNQPGSVLEGWDYNRPAQPAQPPRPPETPPPVTAAAPGQAAAPYQMKRRMPKAPPASPPPSREYDAVGREWSNAGKIDLPRTPAPAPAPPVSGGIPSSRTAAQEAARGDILLDLKDLRKLKLAMLTREVISRPRAFDI